jgi:hypothetical protein
MNFDFLVRDFHFLVPGLDSLAPDFDFLAAGLEILVRRFEIVRSRRSGWRRSPRRGVLTDSGSVSV